MTTARSNGQIPCVVFQPRSSAGMQRGIDRLVAAIRPTLGPVHRKVLIEKESKIGLPELLDDGAVIARRIIQLPNRDEDMGAMYLRQLLWAMHEEAGDGTATAAVIFNAVYKEGLRYIAAGGEAMRLRCHLEKAVPLILCELERQAFPLEGRDQLASLAQTVCYEPELARLLGEVFDIIGEFGQLEIRAGQGRKLEREYIEGMYWNGGMFSREMASKPGTARGDFEEGAVLASDLDIRDAGAAIHVLETSVEAGVKSLLVVASAISQEALSVFQLKANRDKVRVIAVKAPGESTDDHREGLEDLSILCGARLFLQAAGDDLRRLTAADFGFVRRAWADQYRFGISAGKGDPRKVRQHIAMLRAAFVESRDARQRKRLRERIGKLLGGSAALYVGHPSPIAAQARKELAERTAEAMRGAMRGGGLPGGGTALLSCRPLLLKRFHEAEEMEERVAFRILADAVEAPIRALLENAGREPAQILTQIERAGPGLGYDVLRHEIMDMADAGIIDSAAVTAEAVSRAIHGAALALTVDVLIHKSKPPVVYHTT